MSSNLFEEMLSNSHINSSSVLSVITKAESKSNEATKKPHQAINMLRAERSASFDDFISMLSKIVCLTMDELEYEVELIPDEERDKIIDPDLKIDKIYITYNLM